MIRPVIKFQKSPPHHPLHARSANVGIPVFAITLCAWAGDIVTRLSCSCRFHRIEARHDSNLCVWQPTPHILCRGTSTGLYRGQLVAVALLEGSTRPYAGSHNLFAGCSTNTLTNFPIGFPVFVVRTIPGHSASLDWASKCGTVFLC